MCRREGNSSLRHGRREGNGSLRHGRREGNSSLQHVQEGGKTVPLGMAGERGKQLSSACCRRVRKRLSSAWAGDWTEAEMGVKDGRI